MIHSKEINHDKGSFSNKRILKVLNNIDHVVSNSKYTKDLAISCGVNSNKITVINPGIYPIKEIDEKIVKECIKLSTLAPNSSNLQLWEFYHIISKKVCAEISKSCFNQSSAKTSKQFVIPVVRHDLWKNRLKSNIDFIKNNKDDGYTSVQLGFLDKKESKTN